MARKANRYNAVAATSDQVQAVPEKTFRAGLYARLSVEINERPSNSIQTQLDIMRGYVNRHPEIIEAFEYADSGFSGTNFERPNFNRLMDDVRAGKINCILVKDLSRFGRDYLETTNYIEIILPFLGVRFISVNDHFDTDAACNENKSLEIALKNLVNDMYAKDVSKRVSTVRRQEVERGKFTGSNAPYGYVVDDKDPLRHFLIDEPAAAVVRDMYQMADDGMSVREISLELQRRNLSIPGQYLKTGHLYQEEGDEVHIWHIGTIANILRKEEYIGNLVHGRRRSRLYENEKRHFTDKDEWIITENAHEPIVSREQFDRIREKFGKKVKESPFSSERGAGTVKKADKYAGLLFCGECGKKLRYNSRMGRTEGDTSRTYFYQCCNTYDLSNQGYCSVTIMERMLDKIVMESLKMQMQLFSDKGITVEWCREEAAKKLKPAEERVTKIQAEIAKLEYEDFEMHGRFGTGEISRDEMTAYHKSSEKKMAKLRERLSAAEDKQAAIRKDWDDYTHGIEALYRVNGKRKPDRDMLVALIRKISIKHNGEFTIEWNFDRKFKAVDGSYVKGGEEDMKKVAIYMRLSKEDEYIRDESNSISNQRAFLRKHIRSIPELKKLEVVEFKDDGYTGKNMNRPGVQELLDLVKAQKIECIVVKDISRFSRDHLETGKYLEQIFPFMGVRFIAVNDNYDSKDFAGGIGEIDVAFKGILYDFYSEDLSQKVKSSIAARKAKGNYTASVATYGYKKDPEKKGHLIVDEEAAEIVKRIYREYLDGKAIYKIAQGLNDDGIVAPSIHLKRKIGNGYIRHNATLLWTTVCVRRMLCNQTYLGHVVYHKYEQESVGGNDKKVLDPAEWKIVKNMHEPLVSQKDFDKAQKRLQSNRKVKKVYPKHCLSGMVECGICGHNMRHANSGRPKYECAFTYFNINHKHERNSIIDTEIEAAVLAALQKEMDLKAESGKICAERKELQRSKADEAQRRLKDMERSLDQLYEDQREPFESYKAGMTEKDTFLQQKQVYEQMEERLKDKIRQQKEAVERLEDEADAMPDGFSADQDEIQADQLTREMTEAFVEKVIVWPGQKLEIKWKIRK